MPPFLRSAPPTALQEEPTWPHSSRQPPGPRAPRACYSWVRPARPQRGARGRGGRRGRRAIHPGHDPRFGPDTTGGMAVGAAVLVTDDDTGVPRTAESDDSGNYEVPNLRAGRYRVEINAPSFKAFQQNGVVLRAGEIVRADATLVGRRAHGNSHRHGRPGCHPAREPGDSERPGCAAAPDAAPGRAGRAELPVPEPQHRRRPATTGSSSSARAPTAPPTSRTASHPPAASSAASPIQRPVSTPSPKSRCSRIPTAPNTAGSPA